jgi:hypothetical protein
VQYVPPPAPILTFVNDTIFSSETGFLIQWFLNGDAIIGGSDGFYVPTESGDYTVAVFNGYCSATSPSLGVVSTSTLPTSVQSFKLSPNPANEQCNLSLDLTSNQEVVISLLDNNKKNVFQETVTGKNIQKVLQLNTLPTGTYYVNIQLEQGKLVRKLIKI